MNNFNHLEFYNLLQKGLGRTFDYLKQHHQNHQEEIRQGLLNACLHNIAYDPQCEGSRGRWLFELISLTGDEAFYRQNIMQALSITTEFWDIDQLYTLVAIWAKKGDVKAKKLIYKTFTKQDFTESWLGGKEIIDLDGIKGLIYVAKVVGKRILADKELWEDDYLISEASKIFGREKVIKELEKASLKDIKIKAYVDSVKFHVGNLNKKKIEKSKRKTLSFSDIIQYIETTKYPRFAFARFGKNAIDVEIEQIFDRLLQETDRNKLIGYLWIFKDRKFPRLDKYLFKLAQSDETELRRLAIVALANHQDKSIRALALELLTKQYKYFETRVLKLLIKNYQHEDSLIIESQIDSNLDIDEKHYLCMDLIDIIDEQKNSNLTQFAFWIYENTPCSICRKSILEILIDSELISQTILRECLNDSSLDIREIAKQKLELV